MRLRNGWFSDRTATYLLAAGRPVVVQDTGFEIACEHFDSDVVLAKLLAHAGAR